MSFTLFNELSAHERTVLLDVNPALARLRAARKTQIVASTFPGLASWALDSFVQHGLYRIVALGTGMTAEWNERRFLNCIVLSRSLMETVGVWFRVLDDTYKLLPTEDIRRIHSTLMVAMFGTRTLVGDDGALPVAINALTGIDRLDRARPGTRKIYDAICEYVHPNCDGYMLFGEPDYGTGNTELGEHLASLEEKGTLMVATGGAQYLCFAADFVEKYESLFRQQVEMLDTTFGKAMGSWPGDPSDGWRGKP